jgi:hypothetical protein
VTGGRRTATPWDVGLAVPDELADLGLDGDEEEAVARFREQLVAVLGEPRAAEALPAAEREFRAARAAYRDTPVVWSGFSLLATPPVAGTRLDPSVLPADQAAADSLRRAAETPSALLITVTVGVAPLGRPAAGPLTPAAVVARGLRARYGEDVTTHLVTYGTRQAVASVRVADLADASPLGAAGQGPAVGRTVLAEVRIPFVDEDALVTVTAATPDVTAVERAVILAGGVARTVRVRTQPGDGADVPDAGDGADLPDPGDGADAPDPDDGGTDTGPPPTGRLAVVLPDGTRVPDGLTLVGRRPRRTEDRAADHTVTLPHPSVSRTHLALLVEDGAVTATDLGSTNGTVLRRRGETVVLEPGLDAALEAGDHLGVGDVVLRVVADES